MLFIYHASPFCNFNVPCNKGHRRPLLTHHLFTLDLCLLHLITRGLIRPFWPDWSLCIIFVLRFKCFSYYFFSRAGYHSQSCCLWLVAALMRGDRNGTCPLLLHGWSFPLPWWCWRLKRACGSEVSPFFTPAWISQTVIAPGGRPVQRRWRSR